MFSVFSRFLAVFQVQEVDRKVEEIKAVISVYWGLYRAPWRGYVEPLEGSVWALYIYIYIDTTLVELSPDPCFSQIRDVEDFEDPPEIHEALFLKVFTKTKRSRRRKVLRSYVYRCFSAWPGSTQATLLGPQEAKRASGAMYIVKFGFRAKEKKTAAKDRISI